MKIAVYTCITKNYDTLRQYNPDYQKEADFFLRQAPQTPLETAQQLRNKIGDPLYFEYIQETFKDKISPHTDGAYTRTH